MKKIAIFLLSVIVFYMTSCNRSDQKQANLPNILFAISDDQSFEHTSFIGCTFVETPAFDRIAREGIYFHNCYAGSPGCAPSRSSIVTGRYHWQNEQSGQHGSSWMKKYVPFIDLLEANGYITGLTGKGVGPFKYARDERDSLWRKTDAGGIKHSNFNYKKGTPEDERPTDEINTENYFENFKYFIENIRKEKPFFFWYGAKEPHRRYEQDSWKRTNKTMDMVNVPGFFPDHEIVRGDLLDYAVEIEWFDLHLQRMLDYLESIGELENTIVIVTSDNGMPFPRAKANSYEYGVHVPFAVRFPKEFPGNRIVEDPIGFTDIAPTILELTKTSPEGMQAITGKSFLNILKSKKQGTVDSSRKYVFTGRERHSSSRYKNWGYPQRAIRSTDFLLIWNMKPERWPAGAPQKIKPGTSNELLPMFGLDKEGKFPSDFRSEDIYRAFTDIDPSPTKSFIIEKHGNEDIGQYFHLAVDKRPEFELYEVKKDPFCLKNLAGNAEFADVEKELKTVLLNELKKSEDPRVVGPDKEIFDSYIRYSSMREFPKPD